MADRVSDVRAAARPIAPADTVRVGSFGVEPAVGRTLPLLLQASVDPELARKIEAYVAGALPGQTAALDEAVGRRTEQLAAKLSFMLGAKASVSSVDADSATIQIALDSESKLFVEVKPKTVEAVIYRKGSGIEDVSGDDEHSILCALAGIL